MTPQPGDHFAYPLSGLAPHAMVGAHLCGMRVDPATICGRPANHPLHAAHVSEAALDPAFVPPARDSMSYAAMREIIASDARITARVARHLGMPSRTRLDEDRAVEARRGGNRLRRDAWYRAVRSSRRDIIDLIDTIARFVPGMYL